MTLEQLNDRIAELEGILGIDERHCRELFFLRVTPQRRQLTAMLFKRDLVTRTAAHIALYGGRPECSQPEEKIIDVHLVHIRRALQKATDGGVRIDTVWGVGWQMPPACKDKLRQIIESRA